MNNILLYCITVVIWGSTWIAINYQLGDVAPQASLTYRFGLAAALIFSFCLIKGLPLRFNLRQHMQFFCFGLALFGLNYYFIYSAQNYINSALTSIGFSMILIFNILNARVIFGTKITAQVYLGGLLGLLGILTLFWPEISNIHIGNEAVWGLTLCLCGTFIASIGNMISIKNQKLNLPLLPATAWGMFYGALFMAAMTVIQGQVFNFSMTLSYITSLIYLSVFGSVVAFVCYLTLLNRIGAHKASYSSIMFPAVAVIISSVVEDFSWNIYTIIGLLFIFSGNLVLVIKPKKVLSLETKLPVKAIHINE
ncbi:MAG: DMT family transporter [Thalassotalea sp.]|nr:DMT family transporter [Thalassotalea sp.]